MVLATKVSTSDQAGVMSYAFPRASQQEICMGPVARCRRRSPPGLLVGLASRTRLSKPRPMLLPQSLPRGTFTSVADTDRCTIFTRHGESHDDATRICYRRWCRCSGRCGRSGSRAIANAEMAHGHVVAETAARSGYVG